MRARYDWIFAICGVLVCTSSAAQTSAPNQVVETTLEPETKEESTSIIENEAPFRFGAYVEAYYQWNFNRPSNGITNYRGFDNRHDSFTLTNIALDAQADYRDVIGRLTVQVGSTPSTYYLSEPSRAGSAGANATNAELWKYLQQAYVGYRIVDRRDQEGGPARHTFTVTAGLFLSPIGPEAMAIYDNWNWSRSNLFFGCPFYHTGARGTYALSDAWAVTLAAYNGWNSVVDNNLEKSISGQLTYTRVDLAASLLYFGGVERPQGSPEGRPWRNLFDAHVRWNVSSWLSLMAHANAGYEHNRFGAARWLAGALYARARALRQLFVALRGDAFGEHTPSDEKGAATPIFWPVSWVSSGTLTLDYRPHQNISFRAEYRHDRAAGKMYFGDAVRTDTLSVYIPNRRSQNTLTLGATAWF